LEIFLSYEPFIDHADAVAELHAMRIAAKKLRYTMECFSAVYPDELAEYLSVIRVVQDQLGMIHDCDVWQAASAKFIERERLRTEKYYGSDLPMKRLMPGFSAFFEDQRRKRIQAYQSFLDYWHDLIRLRLWDKLRSRLALENHMKHITSPLVLE
jgi:CHAD domain-containing protein